MPKHLIERDPELLAARISPEPGKKMVLGLDLGTSCGYAYAYVVPGIAVEPAALDLHLGQFDLSAGPFDSGAIRFVRFRQFLSALKPDLVVFEDVKYTPVESVMRTNAHAILARAATPLEWFGGLKATVSTWCEEARVPCTSFPIGTIKKRATGKGNSNKGDMIRACNATFGSDMDADDYENAGYDNVADAAWLCLLGIEGYGKGLSL